MTYSSVNHPAVPSIDGVIPPNVRCSQCLLRSDKAMKDAKNGLKKYLCRLNPPQILLRGDEYVPVLPIVRESDFCSGFIDKETKKTFEEVMNIK